MLKKIINKIFYKRDMRIIEAVLISVGRPLSMEKKIKIRNKIFK